MSEPEEEHVNCLNNIDDVEILYPADWWQAFKGRYFPHWLLKRYPVKYNTVQTTIRYFRGADK